MVIYAVDDEKLLLELLNEAILKAEPAAELHSFTRATQLLDRLSESKTMPDAVFIDIELPGMGGLELSRIIKQKSPKTNIIFVTGHTQYALEAIALRPSGYVLKPVTAEKISAELANLRYPPASTAAEKRIRVQCFGNFEVFVSGQPLKFKRAKSKELLACLIDRRGTYCFPAEIAEALWEDGVYDRARQKLFSVIRADMFKTLQVSDADIVACGTRGSLSVKTDMFDCDYYTALSGDTVSINSFIGEYMAPYPWAEVTTACLAEKFGNRN